MDTKQEIDGTRTWVRWVWIAVSVAVLSTVLIVLADVEDTADVDAVQAPSPPPPVSVQLIVAADARAEISVFTELRPQWDAEIRAAVSGRIVEVHDAALIGTQVLGDAQLFSIEPTQYAASVAAAEMALEEARLALLQAENQATVAQRQFDRDGTTPPNELALYLPQLRIAERNLASAQAQLAATERQLAETEVRAPFPGFVTERMASLGQTVSEGEALLRLRDDRQFELVAELNPSDWALLEHPIAGGTAQLFHRDGRRLGEASIRQGGGFLDSRTRQMRVFLEASDETGGLLAGDFLRVTFEGRVLSDTLTLPESALTREGHVWFVGSEGLLVRAEPEILFRSGDTVTITAPDGPGPWQVAVTPLAGFLPGQRVTPVAVEG